MPQGTPEQSPATIAKYIAAVLLISVLSALQAPYQYGNGNHVFQIPKVQKTMEPDLYPDDALVESLRNYPSVVYPAIAWFASSFSVDLEPLYFAIWVVQRIALVALIMLIASRFVEGFPGRVFVTLAACTTRWAVTPTPIGSEHLFAAHMTHTELAFAVQVAALAAWLYRRPVLAGGLIGAAIYLNAMTTAHVAGVLALLWALSEDRWSPKYLRAALVMAVVAIPFVFTLHQAMTGSAGAASETARFWELLRIRSGPHYFIDALDVGAFVSIGAVMFLIGRLREIDDSLRRLMLATVVYTAVMFLVALFGVHLASSKLAVLFHPLRGDKLLHLTLVLAMPIALWREAGRPGVSERMGVALLPGILSIFILGYTPPHVALTALPVALGLMVWVGERRRFVGLDARASAIAALGTAGLLLLWMPDATLFALTLIAAAAAGIVLVFWRNARPLLLVLAVLLGLGLIAHKGRMTGGPGEWYRGGQDREWVSVAEWAERETARDAKFITPTWMEGWRCLSRRSTLVQYRDLSAMHWDVGFEDGCWTRLDALNSAIYYSEDLSDRLRQGYLDLRAGELAAVTRRFSIDYVVMPAEWPHGEGLTPVYANEGYEVFTSAELQHAAATERGED